MSNADRARELILGTKGRFFTVEFVKKDNTIRVMTARTGVKKHLRGGQSTTSHKPNLVTVFDLGKKGYRNVNLETVRKVKIAGKEFIL